MRTGTILSAILLSVLIIAPMIFLFMIGGFINIEYPYKFQYEDCKEDFNELKEAKTPVCAPVECNPGKSGIVFLIFGSVLYIASIGTFLYTTKKFDLKKPKKVKKDAKV